MGNDVETSGDSEEIDALLTAPSSTSSTSFGGVVFALVIGIVLGVAAALAYAFYDRKTLWESALTLYTLPLKGSAITSVDMIPTFDCGSMPTALVQSSYDGLITTNGALASNVQRAASSSVESSEIASGLYLACTTRANLALATSPTTKKAIIPLAYDSDMADVSYLIPKTGMKFEWMEVRDDARLFDPERMVYATWGIGDSHVRMTMIDVVGKSDTGTVGVITFARSQLLPSTSGSLVDVQGNRHGFSHVLCVVPSA